MENLSSILWFILVLVALLLFKQTIRELFNILVWRVKTGSALKIASFEIGAGQYYVSRGADEKNSSLMIRKDEDKSRHTEREKYSEPNRNIYLVHRIAPSKQPNQLYDIKIYLLPHKDATLSNVQKVEYYFGRYWNSNIFTSIDRANGFPISTSAFGPFVCTAKVYFTDGHECMLWRYIDFEMGAVGKEPFSP